MSTRQLLGAASGKRSCLAGQLPIRIPQAARHAGSQRAQLSLACTERRRLPRLGELAHEEEEGEDQQELDGGGAGGSGLHSTPRRWIDISAPAGYGDEDALFVLFGSKEREGGEGDGLENIPVVVDPAMQRGRAFGGGA